MGLAAEVLPVSSSFGTKSFDEFFNICKLFTLQSWLHPVNISDDRVRREIGDVEKYTEGRLAEISLFIRENCFKDQEYRMRQEMDILVVSK
jgi:hypothetical protein